MLALMTPAALLLAAAVNAPARDAFLKAEAEWRAQREASLKKPNGWLSVAGLFWLHDGAMVAGSDPQADIVLPASAPKRAGTLRMKSGAVTFEPAGGVHALISGKPATAAPLKPDTDEHHDELRIGSLSLTVIRRGEKTGIRLRDPDAATRRDFTGCKWFPPSEAWRIQAKWIAYPEPKKIKITNILGMTDDEPSPGYAEFTLGGRTLRLEPVGDETGLEIMFKDASSGKTTYAPGRFLDPDLPSNGLKKNGTIVLDFNQAFNPPCAFTAFATCPLPPRQNALPVAIEAGEKQYSGHASAGGH